jgi:diamine N-acetyltransferase
MNEPTLTAPDVLLRPLEDRDVPSLVRWSEDSGLRRLIGEVAPMDPGEAAIFLERARTDATREWYAVTLKNGRVIGEAGLLRMFPAWRTADLSVIIGEAGQRGKGHGTQAVRLLLDRAFGDLGMHRVAVGVVGFNEGALRFWERLGFRREGVQRDGYLAEGRYHDFVMMSLLEGEYRGR